MVFTDQPYNVCIDRNVSGLGAIRHREFATASGELTELQFEAFLTKSCRLNAQHSVDGALGYFCMDWRHADAPAVADKTSYSELKNICVWVKSKPEWILSTAANTSSSSSSRTATADIETMWNSAVRPQPVRDGDGGLRQNEQTGSLCVARELTGGPSQAVAGEDKASRLRAP